MSTENKIVLDIEAFEKDLESAKTPLEVIKLYINLIKTVKLIISRQIDLELDMEKIKAEIVNENRSLATEKLKMIAMSNQKFEELAKEYEYLGMELDTVKKLMNAIELYIKLLKNNVENLV